MKTFTLVGAACMLLMATSHNALSQANKSLSNLTSPTAVNQDLLPGKNKAYDLGSGSKKWGNLYLAKKLGINIAPAYSLDIYNTTYAHGIHVNNDFSTLADHVGIYSESIIADGYGFGVQGFGGWRGVYGEADAGAYTGSGYGVQGQALGSAGSRYGIYGYATGGTFNAAGYFDGDVWAVSYNYISDRKFKTNISAVENGLQKLMQLKPSVYEFKTSEYSNMGLPAGKQIGLIADEVKAVFPELVKEAVHPAEYGKDKTVLLHPEVKYEGINYMGLIPVAVAAIQEHQKTITDLKETVTDLKETTNVLTKENQELKSRLAAIEQALSMNQQFAILTDAALQAPIPNPTSGQTVIGYFLPLSSGKAAINITTVTGVLVKSIPLTAQGKGQVILNAKQLSAGTYQCVLVVGTQVADTKRLVLTR